MGGKPGRSGPPGHRHAEKHGGYTLLAALNGRRKLDGRTRLGLTLKQIRDSLVRDLGGEHLQDLSQQQQILLQRVLHKHLFCLSIESWLLERGAIVSRKGKLPPALGEHYLAISNSLRLDLQALGLKRRPKPVLPLHAYLAAKYGNPEPQATPGGAERDAAP